MSLYAGSNTAELAPKCLLSRCTCSKQCACYSKKARAGSKLGGRFAAARQQPSAVVGHTTSPVREVWRCSVMEAGNHAHVTVTTRRLPGRQGFPRGARGRLRLLRPRRTLDVPPGGPHLRHQISAPDHTCNKKRNSGFATRIE